MSRQDSSGRSASPLRWRRAVWLVHSWVGLFAGVFLLLIGGSGSIIVFYDEVGRALEPQHYAASAGASLPIDSLHRLVRARHDSMGMSGWSYPKHAGLPHTAYFHKGTQSMAVLVDGATGQDLAALDGGTVINKIRVFHWSFLLDQIGGFAATWFAVILAVSSLTGLIVLRRVTGPFRRPIRWRAGLRTSMGDLHRFVGVSALAINVFWGVSGVWMNRGFLWTPVAGPAVEESPTPLPNAAGLSIAGFEARAREALPGFVPSGIEFPWGGSDTLSLYGEVPGRALLARENGSHVSFALSTGALTGAHAAKLEGAAAWWEELSFTLHAGRFAGWPVELLYVVLGFTPGVLAISGAIIWFTRGRRWLRVDRPAAPRDATPTPYGTPVAS